MPDPERALAEARRVLEPGGTAIFVTPNRLTFGRPDEIIDPYHDVEYDQHELRALCERFFDTVELPGLFGSERYLRLTNDTVPVGNGWMRAVDADPLDWPRAKELLKIYREYVYRTDVPHWRYELLRAG